MPVLGFAVSLSLDSLLAIFYLALGLVPSRGMCSCAPGLRYRRPALRPYAHFWSLYHLLHMFSSALVWEGVDPGYCLEASQRASKRSNFAYLTNGGRNTCDVLVQHTSNHSTGDIQSIFCA
ncbi:unnamed protein product, partial [Discosporangium mesarthrocarpum]